MKVRGLMVCGMLLLSVQAAWAEALRVAAMRLSPDTTWQRGDAAQEKADAVYLLEWPIPQGVALQVAVPRQTTPLKADDASFYANLRKKWASLYGKRAEIGQIEIAGVLWQVCRRPAGEGSAIVFQLATAHAGRAYSLLVFASPQATGLPKPVHDLLAGAEFGVQARDWLVSRVVTARPGRVALDALVRGDAERLGQDGMLTGYGIEYSPAPARDVGDAILERRLAWFMEGFKWRNLVGRDERLPFNRAGHLEVRAPARVKGALTVSLQLATESDSGVEAEVGLYELCAPADEIDAALSKLEGGARAPLARLLRERPAACPGLPASIPSRVLLASPGHPLAETLEFPAAPARAAGAELVSRRILFVKPRLAGDEDDLGQSLLRGVGLYFVYAPTE